MANKLAFEKSPYLLQHANNPVDWYPWGSEAFEKARKENKPIFLSIGYSTCHWCHVMAHESFENEKIAAIMNQYFVNIKLDREERPDIDALYMTVTQMLTQSGGWPMSVWLTPDLKPFFAGTYFPPEDRYGRSGFPSLLMQIKEAWESEQAKILKSSDEITSALKEALQVPKKENTEWPSINTLFSSALYSLEMSFDQNYGGFGRAPKFPMPVNLEFLIFMFFKTKNPNTLRMAEMTFQKMAEGGIYDQLGGGFARYSTDDRWVVPHFEKMLYDNAQLIRAGAHLYQATKKESYKKVLENTIAYIKEKMTHPDGGFYSAEDADSEGKEGTYYLWTIAEIKKNLPEELADIFIDRYGLTIQGNFLDPHTREEGKNVLVIDRSLDQVSFKFKKTQEEITSLLEKASALLLSAREKRRRPHLDDKILTGWNGLMISALAETAGILDNKKILDLALNAASFIEKNLFDPIEGVLYKRFRDGEKKIQAQQPDYAELIEGLIHLFEVSGDPHWLTWAISLQEKHNELFYDKEQGGFFMTTAQKDLLIQMKEESDNVIPSGNSVAIRNNFILGSLANKPSWTEMAKKSLLFFSKMAQSHSTSVLNMVMNFDFVEKNIQQVIILGPMTSLQTHTLVQSARTAKLPRTVILQVDPSRNQSELANINPEFGSYKMKGAQPTAFFCSNFVCQEPTNDPNILKTQIEQFV